MLVCFSALDGVQQRDTMSLGDDITSRQLFRQNVGIENYQTVYVWNPDTNPDKVSGSILNTAFTTPPLKILPQHPANHKPTRRINMFWLNGVMLGKIGHRARNLG